jgi:hypothetical protein
MSYYKIPDLLSRWSVTAVIFPANSTSFGAHRAPLQAFAEVYEWVESFWCRGDPIPQEISPKAIEQALE